MFCHFANPNYTKRLFSSKHALTLQKIFFPFSYCSSLEEEHFFTFKASLESRYRVFIFYFFNLKSIFTGKILLVGSSCSFWRDGINRRTLSQNNGLLLIHKNQSRAKLLTAKWGEIDCLTVFPYNEVVSYSFFLLVQMNNIDLFVLLRGCWYSSEYCVTV